jgi:hypothetical protein
LDTGHNPFHNPLPDLNLQPGHAYEMTDHGDPVASFNRFGLSPGYMPDFTHLATDPTTTPDGVSRDGSIGHSEYPTLGNGQLRTSGYNIATVVAGIPDRVVKGQPGYEKAGEDVLGFLAGH